MLYTAGLLHDIGKVVIAQTEQGRYAQCLTSARERGERAHVAERKEFGIDHAEAGKLLLEEWGVPESLAMAVGGHHDPSVVPEEHRLNASILRFADDLVWRISERPGDVHYKWQNLEDDSNLIEHLPLDSTAQLRAIRERAVAALKKKLDPIQIQNQTRERHAKGRRERFEEGRRRRERNSETSFIWRIGRALRWLVLSEERV
jgi:HD-like signal output (HDOD) protein